MQRRLITFLLVLNTLSLVVVVYLLTRPPVLAPEVEQIVRQVAREAARDGRFYVRGVRKKYGNEMVVIVNGVAPGSIEAKIGNLVTH